MIRLSKFACIWHLMFFPVIIFFPGNICAGDFKAEFNEFQQAINNGDISKAMNKGESIFKDLEVEYFNNPGFNSLKSKLTASIFLSKKMNDNLSGARKQAMFNQVGIKNKDSLTVPPAKSYYTSAEELFSKPISVEGISQDHKLFLGKYYNLRLRALTTELGKTGQGLAIAEPAFKGTFNYVLVLPLLHCLDGSPVDLDTLPEWTKKNSNAEALSEACLKHFGLPFQAMSISKGVAMENGREFNTYNYYIKASKNCVQQLPAVAVECLDKAIQTLGDKKLSKAVSLRFDIVKIWLDNDRYALAAGYAKELSEDIRGTERYPESVWDYFYALSRSNNFEAILSNINTALNDDSCAKYHAKLLYIKWWSLRRSRADIEQVMAIEKKLMDMYPDNPMLAPIWLYRATDLLAKQDYQNAIPFFEMIVKKFPGTKSAAQANKILEKLEKMLNGGS